ncbi:MAG: phosphoribosylaminoimidazolesuccinocarboxamide synthase [Oscillospiraceae bacterium]|nr:phosphoribosylaminoimidazolesuccinocarboxamide synthase [Oscillospiraceae bacterium]
MKKIISGKVREVFEINERELVIVTTDRISAFDVILPTLIPAKGIMLNKIANFWFDFTKDIVTNHIISEELADMPEFFQKEEYTDRTVKVKKIKMMEFEFIVRGYMFGNMWNEYKKNRSFCGYTFDKDYNLASMLETPILTPSTKSTEGHDIYITMDKLRGAIGAEETAKIEAIALELYKKCYEYALTKGIILADTKFEFGYDENGGIVLADEIFTPDSSRFWDASKYVEGASPASYDKQFVRDWLIANKMDGVTPPPEIPEDIVMKTSALYKECYEKLVN